VAGFPGPCRGATGRLRQKGEADLLHTSKLGVLYCIHRFRRTYSVRSVHFRNVSKSPFYGHCHLEPTPALSVSAVAVWKICGTDRPEPFPDSTQSVKVVWSLGILATPVVAGAFYSP
jgi:hypothetical protein